MIPFITNAQGQQYAIRHPPPVRQPYAKEGFAVQTRNPTSFTAGRADVHATLLKQIQPGTAVLQFQTPSRPQAKTKRHTSEAEKVGLSDVRG